MSVTLNEKNRLYAVLFDLIDTLVETAPVLNIFNRILAKHGIELDLEDRIISNLETEYTPPLSDYELPYIEFWREFNIKILKQMGVKTRLEEIADFLTSEWWSNAEIRLYPEVKYTLKTLRTLGIKIGIVTNAFQKDIQDILAKTNLSQYFQVTVGADDVKKPKPHKDIFLHAVHRLKVSPIQTMFVGDLIEADYYGSKNAGLQPILIDRKNTVDDNFRKVHNLKEILTFFTSNLDKK